MLSFVSFCESSFVSPPALGSSAPSRGAAAVSMSGVTRNAGMGKLQAGYLFPEIGRRRNAYLEANPDAKIISLGIGDTTMPVPPHILAGLTEGASRLGTNDGYSGYGPENGVAPLREKIASSLYDDKISPDEIFVSDGSKCDIGRLQMMFGSGVTSAVQDPSYPVYVDTSVMMGQTGEMDQATKQYGNIVYMPCNPGNGFFPDVSKVKADVIYFCSPNNPTGAAATRAQLQSLVDHANKQGSIIVFDAAYAPFIRSGDVPKSIFEIDGARTCAIEVRARSGGRANASARDSFAHSALHTVRPPVLLRPGQLVLEVRRLHRRPPRLDDRAEGAHVRRRLVGEGRLQPRDEHVLQRRVEHRAARRDVVPRQRGLGRDQEADRLLYGEWCAARDIRRLTSIAQFGRAIRRHSAAQSSDGAPTLTASAAAMLKSTMEGLGYTTHGGTDAPYVFVDLEGKSSWDTFSELLESSQVVTIPGAGFGPGGEGFLRLSAFAPRAACEEACERLKKAFAGKK